MLAKGGWSVQQILTRTCCVAGAGAPEPEGAAVPQSGAPEESGGAAKRGLCPLAVLLWTHAIAHPHLRNATAHCCLTYILEKMHICGPQILWGMFTIWKIFYKVTPFFVFLILSQKKRGGVTLIQSLWCQRLFVLSLVSLHFSLYFYLKHMQFLPCSLEVFVTRRCCVVTVQWNLLSVNVDAFIFPALHDIIGLQKRERSLIHDAP